MSRALRRHPASQKSGKPGRQRKRAPKPPIPGAAGGKRPPREPAEGRGLLSALRPRWAEDIFSELRKVSWPSREDTWYLTFVVLIVASAFGIFLGGVDMFFNWAIDRVLIR